MSRQNADGEIFIDEKDAPPVFDIAEPDDEFPSQVYENQSDHTTHHQLQSDYVRTLARWRDPLSPPHSRSKCVKWARTDFPPIKTCVGWKTEYKWIYNKLIIKIEFVKPDEARNALTRCLAMSVVAGSLAAIISKGSVAIPTAERVFDRCLKDFLQNDLVNVSLWITPRRGDWE